MAHATYNSGMPFYKRGFRFPRPGEAHSMLWEIGGVLFILAIIKTLIEYFLFP
jgi:hypothetical protein